MPVKKRMTAGAATGHLLQVLQFPTNEPISPMMGLQVVRVITDLASVTGSVLNSSGYFPPIIGFEMVLVVHCWDA